MEKSPICMNQGCSAEESGWTLYFEDFLCNNNNEKKQDYSFLSSSDFSLVSDAASSASAAVGFSPCRNLSFKKRRSCITNKTSSLINDDSLEDTATSPVNSPKGCNIQENIMSRKEKEYAEILEEKGGNISTRNEYTTALKKRGLCLVPVSTIANYIG